MLDESGWLGGVPKLSIARNWDKQDRNQPGVGARFMAVDVDQFRYYFPYRPTYKGSQSAVFVAVRDDGTPWALVARRIADKRGPAPVTPRIPDTITNLRDFAEEVELLQKKLDLPREEQPTALFVNNHATKAYGIYPLGGITLDDVLRIMPSKRGTGWMDRFRETTVPVMSDAHNDVRVLRLIATQLIIEFYAALQPVHAQGYAMHDAKPANMVARLGPPRELDLPTPAGPVSVCSYFFPIDYGNATPSPAPRGKHGTCPFEAPEQISSSKETGQFSDLWAVGAVLMKELLAHPISYDQVPQAAVQNGDIDENLHDIRSGLNSPFDTHLEDHNEVTVACRKKMRAYERWYAGKNSYEVDEQVELEFSMAFGKLKLVGSDIEALVRKLLNPSKSAREQMSLLDTLGQWLADHPQDLAEADLLMHAMLHQAPLQTELAEDALDAITDAVMRDLNEQIGNGKAK